MIITENRTLAESNLQKEPNLIESRSRINDLSEEFRNLSENVQTKLIQLSESSLIIYLMADFVIYSLLDLEIRTEFNG